MSSATVQKSVYGITNCGRIIWKLRPGRYNGACLCRNQLWEDHSEAATRKSPWSPHLQKSIVGGSPGSCDPWIPMKPAYAEINCVICIQDTKWFNIETFVDQGLHLDFDVQKWFKWLRPWFDQKWSFLHRDAVKDRHLFQPTSNVGFQDAEMIQMIRLLIWNFEMNFDRFRSVSIGFDRFSHPIP